MKTSLQRIVADDGIELVGLLYEPDQPASKILVHVHGMAGNFYENRFLDYLAHTLTAAGVAFFAFNNRGCELAKDLRKHEGEKRTLVRIGDAFEKFEDSALDIKAAVDFAASKGFSAVHLSGHSLGGPKVAYYLASTQDKRVRSVVFISPADMVGLAKQNAHYERDRSTAEKMITEGKGAEQMPFLVWDENNLSADTYLSITSERSPVAIFNLYDKNDPLATLGKISVPALTIMGSKDEALTVSVEELMSRTKAALTNSPKAETNIMGDAKHSYAGYEQQLADAVSGWIA